LNRSFPVNKIENTILFLRRIETMKKRNENKGFTLVELIVVLVILAILAAILVPALLGYIDRAREKQYVLNAKSALTAAQAELSSIYGEGGNLKSLDATRKATIKSTADVPGTAFTIGTKAALANDTQATSANHDSYTIGTALYEENDVSLYFNGSSWTQATTAPTNAIEIW